MANTTSDLPPGWVEEYCGNKAVTVAILFIPLTVLFAVLRFISRSLIKAPLGWDDILIPLSVVFIGLLCGGAIAMVQYTGTGYHYNVIFALYPEKYVLYKKSLIIMPVLYSAGVTLPKLAIVVVYLRIFSEPPYRITSWTIAGVVIVSGIANVLLAIFQCIPIAKFWHVHDPDSPGKCINIDTSFTLAPLPNILTDVVLLVLPLPPIFRLRLSINQKIGIILTFLTGSIGLVTSIVRFSVFAESLIRQEETIDDTWDAVYLIIVTIVEPSMYLIAACLLACRPLSRFIKKRIQGWGGGDLSTTDNVLNLSASATPDQAGIQRSVDLTGVAEGWRGKNSSE